ncbi:hypothetical protein JA9_003124 [Meyerozyma sp. JA9]|nr:hypothetical protein JA9_003124 [Meyerozyma sp. JA9]
MGLISFVTELLNHMTRIMLQSLTRRAYGNVVRTIGAPKQTPKLRSIPSYAYEERNNCFAAYKQTVNIVVQRNLQRIVDSDRWVTALSILVCVVLGCNCLLRWTQKPPASKALEKKSEPQVSSQFPPREPSIVSQWNKYASGIQILTAAFKAQVSSAPNIASEDIEVCQEPCEPEETNEPYSDILEIYDDEGNNEFREQMEPSLSSITTRKRRRTKSQYVAGTDTLSDPYIEDTIVFLKSMSRLNNSEVHASAIDLIHHVLRGQDLKTAVGVLSLLCKIDYIGKNEDVSAAVGIIRNTTGANLLTLFTTAVSSLPEYAALLDMTVDYVLYSEDSEIESRVLEEYFRSLIHYAFFDDNSPSSHIVLHSFGRVICALDVAAYEETFLQICLTYFQSNERSDIKSFEMIRIMKDHMSLHKDRVRDELVFDPYSNKAHSLAYKNLRALLQILPVVVYDTTTGNNTEALVEANQFYHFAADLLINRRQIPLAIQIDLLANYFSPIYKILDTYCDLGHYEINPPILQGVQLGEALFK